MTQSTFYHQGSRRLQAEFGSRPLADRLEAVTLHREFTEEDRAFMEGAPFFLLATADARGRPDCSFKGGMPGFVRVTGPDELIFPDYDGNGMFRSLGNIAINPSVGLLFMAFDGQSRRLRINGEARLVRDDPEMGDLELDDLEMDTMPGAQLLVRVRAREIFPNCPRYIPEQDGTSRYWPRPGITPPEPAWKAYEAFSDVVPPRR